jgi:hypothetical protein
MHESILTYRRSLFAWWALGLSLLSIVIYWSQSAGSQVPNGGTWQGYVLGGLATFIIIILTVLGIRKRSYQNHALSLNNWGSVQAWTSAHVYLGLIVLLIATLHCAAQFGWNVHTLAYGLMFLVIVSGFFGLYAYLRYPQLLSQNRAGRTDKDIFAELNQLNEKSRDLGQQCNPLVAQVVDSCIARTAIGGSKWMQLMGSDKSTALMPSAKNNYNEKPLLTTNKNQQAVIDYVAYCIPRTRKKQEASLLQELLTLLSRRQTILRQLRRDIQLRAGLKIWLLFHIPLTIGLLVSLAIHIISVFFFW